MKKKFLLIVFLSILIFTPLLISLSPWFIQLATTPADRVFTGINRWSGDYFTYLSYVELGRRGEILARLLAITDPQQPVFTHLAHTAAGFVLGKVVGLNSIFSYHIARAFYGLVFLYLTFVFFYYISRSRTVSIVAFFLTFFITGFPRIESFNPLTFSRYLPWLQEQNIIGRPTGPLHYSAGFIFFILTVLWWFTVKTTPIKKIIITGILLNLTLLANPFAFLILALSFGLYSIINVLLTVKISNCYQLTLSFLFTLPLFLYNQYFLSQEPWGKLGLAPKYYVVGHLPIGFFDAIMSIGPIFFLGIGGMIFILIRNAKLAISIPSMASTLFLISWLTVQFFLFFFGDYVRLDPVRSFNGLYYLPLALFSSYSIIFFINKILHINKKSKIFVCWILTILLILFAVTWPNYSLSYKDQLYAFTDYKNFSTFVYPTVTQVEAFKWLEKNTPVGSGVLALYESSFHIIGLSGNATAANMDHNQKAPFYTGQMADSEAYQYLKNNHFQYVYYGYQERFVGGNIEKYPFLKKIYTNPEVVIYQVN